MAEIKIKLADGRKLFFPLTRTLMKEGKIYTVQAYQFWNRRISDGDVIQVTQKSSKTQSDKTEIKKSGSNK